MRSLCQKELVWEWFGDAISDISTTSQGSSGGDTAELFNQLKINHPKEYAESASLRAAQLNMSATHKTKTKIIFFLI